MRYGSVTMMMMEVGMKEQDQFGVIIVVIVIMVMAVMIRSS